MSYAQIKKYNGQPTLMIDGQPYPPWPNHPDL